ncbi:ABC transporter ATP-binding protein [Micromonospora lutea]|uniref:Spermidine/putrescine import ATP-binding protein PotA n=1 Tax=Micromonospora lutea TaxID=419825 RepID=A0ABQ4J147_9ACTN|nr:ABC transporter ATP-binding protein [Micromonospora lutea]GIJ23889.1 polyamine-transporting ATPase [Micromonospora lutea]
MSSRAQRGGAATAPETNGSPAALRTPAEAGGSDSRQLRFTGVTKRYQDFEAVRGFDLDVRGGEFLTLLGPSGSGKTTVLSMVAGFQSPTVGSIHLGGQRLDRLPPERRDIGMVFQSYALFPHMTVQRNVAFPLRMRGIRGAELARRVSHAIDLVQLGAHSHKYPTQLSGGQQQRAALARAIVFEPPVLLMDEPLGALDRRLREAVQFELVNLHRQIASTIIYVTHDQDEALTMSDRIVIMNEGRIEQVGTPREIYASPANAFVATFMGESVEFRGRVERIADGICTLRTADGVHVKGRNGPGLAVGDEAVVVVRPERITLAPAADGTEAAGVSGRIAEVLYMGQRSRNTVQIDGGSVLHLIRENTVGVASYAAGDDIVLRWAADEAVVLR